MAYDDERKREQDRAKNNRPLVGSGVGLAAPPRKQRAAPNPAKQIMPFPPSVKPGGMSHTKRELPSALKTAQSMLTPRPEWDNPAGQAARKAKPFQLTDTQRALSSGSPAATPAKTPATSALKTGAISALKAGAMGLAGAGSAAGVQAEHYAAGLAGATTPATTPLAAEAQPAGNRVQLPGQVQGVQDVTDQYQGALPAPPANTVGVLRGTQETQVQVPGGGDNRLLAEGSVIPSPGFRTEADIPTGVEFSPGYDFKTGRDIAALQNEMRNIPEGVAPGVYAAALARAQGRELSREELNAITTGTPIPIMEDGEEVYGIPRSSQEGAGIESTGLPVPPTSKGFDVTKLKSETAMGDESEQGFVIDKTTGKIREFGGQRQPEGLANPEIEEAQANMQAFFNANPREAQDDPAALERAFWSWYNNRER